MFWKLVAISPAFFLFSCKAVGGLVGSPVDPANPDGATVGDAITSTAGTVITGLAGGNVAIGAGAAAVLSMLFAKATAKKDGEA